MTRYVFYDRQSGALALAVAHIPPGRPQDVALNTPAGHIACAHESADPAKHRFNPQTKEFELFQSPRPGPDYEWDEKSGAWLLGLKGRVRAEAIAQIRALEAAQSRSLREAILGNPSGLEYLRHIEAQILKLRAQL